MQEMFEREQEPYWLWLCSVPRLYERDRRRLLQYYHEPQSIWEALETGKLRGECINEKKLQILKEHRKAFCPREAYHKCRQSGIEFISCRHPQYPPQLLEIFEYPSGIFYSGALPQKEEVCVAVVGARTCSSYGSGIAGELAAGLAACGVSVVSGMAYGIDAYAQQSCLDAGGKSYGVLGCGADVCYPQKNRVLYERLKEQGGVISELPPGTPPLALHFPMRNRIISGLVKTVVIVEAKERSGTLITADFALEQGRDVYAVPGRVGDVLSVGCNRLIQQGAGIYTDAETFLREYGYARTPEQKTKKSKLVLATSENLVYSCVDSQSKSLQEIISASKLGAGQVMSALSALQLKGLVEENAKNYYAKTR